MALDRIRRPRKACTELGRQARQARQGRHAWPLPRPCPGYINRCEGLRRTKVPPSPRQHLFTRPPCSVRLLGQPDSARLRSPPVDTTPFSVVPS